MKQLIIASTILLVAGAIYGFIDYHKQSNSGRLALLYKDEKYNSGGKVASLVFAAAKVEKKIDLDDYSRKPFRKEQFASNYKNNGQKKVQVNTKQKSNEVVTTIVVKANEQPVVKNNAKAEVEKGYEKVNTKSENTEPKTDAIKIVYMASAEDSTAYRNNEAKAIKRAMFSRAPIRKKATTVIVINADSAVLNN